MRAYDSSIKVPVYTNCYGSLDRTVNVIRIEVVSNEICINGVRRISSANNRLGQPYMPSALSGIQQINPLLKRT